MKVLVLTAHPDLEKSRVNRIWFDALSHADGVKTRDLTQVGAATMLFDVEEEQKLLLEHDRIVFQFPFYWYSAPPILKSWIDQVLNYGFAYGPGGTKLSGKELLIAVSTGGPAHSYAAGGYNNFSMSEFLRPFQQTALLAEMTYLKPFVFHGMATATTEDVEASVHDLISHITDTDLDPKIRQQKLLKQLADDPEKAAAIS